MRRRCADAPGFRHDLADATAARPCQGASPATRVHRRSLFFSFGPQDLSGVIRGLGVAAGDVVLVHCSFDAFRAFTGRPADVVQLLQTIVGRPGAVLMPTMPFSGTAVQWAHAIIQPSTCDEHRPRMGLVSEVFRRSPDVIRSIHPTHPVAAWGDRARNPGCGSLARDDALWCWIYLITGSWNSMAASLLMGADISSLTFFHTAEALLASEWPASPFTVEKFRLRTIATDGSEYVTETHLFDPSLSRRRNLFRILPELKARGAWKQSRVGRLTVALVRARDVLDVVSSLAERGIYAYDDYPSPGPRR